MVLGISFHSVQFKDSLSLILQFVHFFSSLSGRIAVQIHFSMYVTAKSD